MELKREKVGLRIEAPLDVNKSTLPAKFILMAVGAIIVLIAQLGLFVCELLEIPLF